MTEFDLLNVPLEGANLLEASAGTGKTYNIEGLFLRLIVEEALPVGEILVVTYTVAATEELRDRIRRKLRDAAATFSGAEGGEPFLRALAMKFPDSRERLLCQGRLRAALRDFDEAAIFTIHGFCQRMLQENAFESKSLFDTELITDERAFREEIAEDFWRIHFYENIPEMAGFALSRGLSPDYFRKLLDNVISCYDAKIIPDISSSPLPAIKERVSAYNSLFAGVLKLWPAAREEVSGKLKSSALHGAVYGKKTEGLIKAMEGFLASGEPYFPLFQDFEKFTARRISASVKKNQQAPEHAFFNLCQTIQESADTLTLEMENYLLFLKAEIIRTVRRELDIRKTRKNKMFYDDLLLKMRDALKGRGGEELSIAVRKKYKAALIDEFQDTDPVQFAIFETLFGRGETPFFLIGDPKQAIYSFRGADIFAYMKAATGLAGQYTIAENWRSEPGLVKAVNALFSQRGGDPFVFREISFSPARAAGDKEHEYFTLGERRDAPFKWWFVPAEEPTGKPLSRGKAEDVIIRAIAAEIVRLLNAGRRGEALIGRRPLKEADIAVLVRTNREARHVQEGLRRLHVPSVLHYAGGVFNTREAGEMGRIMAALSAPEEESLIRAALLTDVLGVKVEEMEALSNDEGRWTELLEKFRQYRDVWFETGFIGMFTTLMAGENVRPRLLSFPDGERRLTNLLHLSEALERASGEPKLSPRGLVKWLKEQMDPAATTLDEHQLRLESDEKAVGIITVHKSKGLEYPVVFCPFTWSSSEIREDVSSFHDEQDGGRLACHLGFTDDGHFRAAAAREILAENVRLLYVALTRAKHRCYFVWGRFNKAETSAPAYLFHSHAQGEGEDDVTAAIAADYKKLTDEALYRRMEEIALKAEGEIGLSQMPSPEGGRLLPLYDETEEMTFREFSGRIDRSRRIVSFTSLVSERRHDAETPDYDGPLAGESRHFAFLSGNAALPRSEALSEPDGAEDIFSFPRGADAGKLLHNILENFDFAGSSRDAAGTLLSEKLRLHGFSSGWGNVIVNLLERVAKAPLYPFNGSGSSDEYFTLSSISGRERLSEVEFYFPLRRLTHEDLKKAFSRQGGLHFPDAGGAGTATDRPNDFSLMMERLHFNPAQGFMKGFMDMVFCFKGRYYLVDWKSNFLGGRAEDYGRPALARAMTENFYILQYHIYMLALHQYLALRLPGYRYGEHMGGVYYIFLRGLDPALGPDFGIYRDRPEEGLIAALADKLIAR
jgi:exodeoxyribonuclease V beta subunit